MKKLRTGKISKPRPALEDVFAFATMMQRQKSMSENRGEMIAEGLLGVVRPLTPNTRNAAVASLEKGLRNMHVRNKSSLGKVVKADEYYEEEKEGEARKRYLPHCPWLTTF